MDSILSRSNRHLFIEDKDNIGNSFIANVNFLVNKFSDIKDINSKFTAEDIAAIRELLDAIKNASDQTGQQSSSDSSDSSKISQDLSIIIEDLIKGSLHGCRKLDINLLKNFANYDENMTDDEKRQLWSQDNSQVYYSSMDVYFVDKTFITKEFTSLVRNHHQLRDQMHDWPELAEKMEGTGIEIVPNRPLYNHELLRIYDTTLEGSTIESVVLHVADEEQCGKYAAVFSGTKNHNPRYSWMDTTSALQLVANILPNLQYKVETAASKAEQALENAEEAESLVNRAVEARNQACECAETAVEAQQDVAEKVGTFTEKADAVLSNVNNAAANALAAQQAAMSASDSANAAKSDAALANRYSTNAAVDVLEKVQAGILVAKYEDYPEFLRAYLDQDGKFLWGIRADGSVDWAKGVPQGVKDYLEEYYGIIDTDDEYIRQYKDANGKFICGIHKDGSINWTKGVPDGIKEYLDNTYGYTTSNDDYLKVYTDAVGKFIFGIKKDGSIEWMTGIPTAVKNYMSTFMYRDDTGTLDMMAIHDDNGQVVEAIDFKGDRIFNKDVFINGDLRVDGKITGVEKIKGVCNWTKKKDMLHIPIPECAIVKIERFVRPANKIDMCHAKMEFWDMQGNYFQKKIDLGLQGNSTWNLPKPNYKFDLFADDWGDDEFVIQFGDWVPQDSFHLKAFYTDFLCGRAIVVYQWWQEICNTRGMTANTTWKQAIINMDDVPVNMPAIDYLSYANVPKDDIEDLMEGKLDTEDYISYRLDTGAKCVPDAFPCIVYINDRFHGIFSWQLKKNKDNYHLKKNDADHIHIDGFTQPATMWMGNVQWRGEEIRYPKNLFCTDGSIYDGDLNMNEIMGEDSPLYDTFVDNYEDYFDKSIDYWKKDVRKKKGKPAYDEKYAEMIAQGATKAEAKAAAKEAQTAAEKKVVKKTLKITAKVKKNILRLSNAIANVLIPLDEQYDATNDLEEKAAIKSQICTEFEKYFYPDNLIDYSIMVDLDGDGDSINNNCQWVTWDGKIWFANVYDCNGAFGGNGMGNAGLLTNHRVTSNQYPWFYALKYYKEEAEARYRELRELGLLDADYIIGKLNDWVRRIGINYYMQEFDMWYNEPSINNATVNTGFWELQVDEDGLPITGDSRTYNPDYNYQENDIVYSGFIRMWKGALQNFSSNAGIYKFKCIKANRGVWPFKNNSIADNIWHLYKWYEAQLAIMDSIYNYS